MLNINLVQHKMHYKDNVYKGVRNRLEAGLVDKVFNTPDSLVTLA